MFVLTIVVPAVRVQFTDYETVSQSTGKLPRELSLIPSTAFRKEEANAQNSNGGGAEGSEPNTGPELCPLLPREGTAVASS